jgi:hypothetical protein
MLNYAFRHEHVWGLWIRIYLTSALVGDEWSASSPGRFTPGERVPRTQWIGGCVGVKFRSCPEFLWAKAK